jgi:hypothetical protein
MTITYQQGEARFSSVLPESIDWGTLDNVASALSRCGSADFSSVPKKA